MSKKKQVIAPIEENIIASAMDELMGERFDIYAKDVIQDRAIPDARDGLKPVQRRIIFAMYNTGNTIDKPTKKCAHIVGEVMGKFHPHGDSSIYNALVRMSQPWRVRLPLIDFQGNNGSMDGDGAAAYRYTEARLSAVSQELIRDLDKNSCDMMLNFDDTLLEPTVLPAHFPNLLVNGASGIAVGMATEIPPHNLGEIIDAVCYRLAHPNCPIETLMKFVPGPDFPTGGTIYKSQGLLDIYLTGKGRIDVVSKYSIEEEKDGTTQIIVTEIPYGVVKKNLVFSIDKIRHDKAIDGIDEVRDESDKEGLRIAIDIKKGFKAEAILAYLLGKTQLRSSYSANMMAIVNGRPQTLNLLSYCDTYIDHQKEIWTRKTKFDLNKCKARLSIINGLIKAASIINEVIAVIRASKDKADSKINLENKFGFLPDQSEAIVMMPLYKLSHTDIDVLMNEKVKVEADIASYEELLSDQDKLDKAISNDLKRISKIYSDERRTSIEEEDPDLRQVNAKDLIAKEEVMVTVTRDGYIKRCSLASYKGSNGHNGAYPGMKSGDTLVFASCCLTTDNLLLFTNNGCYIYLPIHMVKISKWLDEGIHLNYAVSLSPDDRIVKVIAVRKFREDINIATVSRKGQIKRTKLSLFPVTRMSKPIRCMRLLGDDEVTSVCVTSGNSNLLLLSESGLGVFYNENEISLTSNGSSGIKAASFKASPVIALIPFDPEENGKVMLLTDLGVTRVLASSNVELSNRLSKATTIFKSFKKEPHNLVFADKVGDKVAPYTIKTTLDDGSYFDITYEDFFLTPMDKVAKVENKIPGNKTIQYVSLFGSDIVTNDTKAYEPPVIETVEPVEEETAPKIKRDDDIEEKFEQISIFDDNDF